jgi:tetratricopeptide (TPR) repeat protein
MLQADELGPFADALLEDSRRRRDPRRHAAGILHAAQIVERRLGDAERAAMLYREALAADPGSTAAREALHDLLASRGDAAALAALYGAQLGDDPPVTALLHHARWLAEIEGERPQALAQAERARAKDPRNPIALRLCETLAARLGRWAEWTEVQEGLAARFPEPADALEYLLGAALAKEAEPDAAAGARPARDDYRAALGLAPENAAVQLWLYHLARTSSDPAALAEVLDRMAASARDGLARATLLTRLGDLRPDAAEVLWRQALEAYPEFLPALKQLRRRAEESVDHDALATLSELEAVAAVDPVQKAAAWLRAGDAAGGPLADAARARAALAQVLALEPGNDDAFERLMELLAAADDPAALRAALQHRIEAQHEPSALVPLLLRIGELSRDRLGQREDAKRAFARATALDPRSLPALVALGDLYYEDGQWQEAAGAAARVIKLSTERPVLRAHFARLGTLYADWLVDPHKAIECFRRASNLADGGDVSSLERLVELHRRQGDWASAIEVTGRLSAAAREPAEKIRHLLGLASIHEQGRMDAKAALVEIRRALQVDNGDLDALEALAGLFERGGNQRARQMELERAAQIFVARVKSAPTDPVHYRGLLTVQIWAGLTRQASATAEALEVLGVTDPEVQAAKSMLPPPQTAGFPDPGPLFSRESEERWSAGAHFTVNSALAEIGPWAPRVFQIDAARFGAGKAERIAAGPMKELCDQAARAFGVGPYELYVSRRVPTAAAAIPGEPPQIVLGAGVLEGATPAELKFIAARCMVLIRRGHGVVPFVSAEDFGRLLTAAAAAGEVAGKADAAQLEVNKALYKALPRKSRKELAPIALELVARSAEAPALQSAIIQDANRVALAACDQLPAAIDALGRMNGMMLRGLRDPAARTRAIAPIVEITALLAFSITDQRQEMRRLVGLG